VTFKVIDIFMNTKTSQMTRGCFERMFNIMGYKNGGLVIFRTTYGNEKEWQQFLDVYNQRALEGLQFGGPEVAAKYATTVIEDPGLADANSIQVNKALRKWVLSEEVDG